MTTDEMNELLAGVISAYAPTPGKKISRKVALKLTTSNIEQTIQCRGCDTYVLAKDALCKCGVVIEENYAHKIISGVILAGAANMNPCFIVLWSESDTIHIKACAKEGFIKQHTAKRAIQIFKSALNNCC